MMTRNLKFKKQTKIIVHGSCKILLIKDRPNMEYWYANVYNHDYSSSYFGDITKYFASIVPYFRYRNKLVLYHNMDIIRLSSAVKEFNESYSKTYYINEKLNKKRRIKL